jgi:DNA-binding transcriptional LysR family regulator
MGPTKSGEIPHLETFSKAAELLNFTAAADELCMTQAAVSQRIKALEDELGILLFDRHAGRVTLTDAGRSLYDYAQRILALHDEARRRLGEARQGLSGELRLAASTVPGEHLLPAIVGAFQRTHPDVRVVATVADSAQVLQALEREEVALALVGRAGPSEWSDSTPFARDRLLLIVPPKHRWAKRSSITLQELREEPLILRESGSGSRSCLEEGLSRVGWKTADLRISLELGSNEAIKEAVLRGAGVALLSAFAVRHDLDTGRLHGLTVEGAEMCRDLYVVTDRRRVLPPTARAFLEVLETTPFLTATAQKTTD